MIWSNTVSYTHLSAGCSPYFCSSSRVICLLRICSNLSFIFLPVSSTRMETICIWCLADVYKRQLPVSVFQVLLGNVLCPLHFQVSDCWSYPWLLVQFWEVPTLGFWSCLLYTSVLLPCYGCTQVNSGENRLIFSFLNSLIKSLLKKMDEDDNL